VVLRRIVPDLTANDFEAFKAFYSDMLGLRVGMDLGWVMTLVSPDNHPTAQITVMRRDETAPVNPNLSIEVEDVDRVYEFVQSRGMKIVHPLTDEPWGVRRFFVVDPTGAVVNIMSHARGHS